MRKTFFMSWASPTCLSLLPLRDKTRRRQENATFDQRQTRGLCFCMARFGLLMLSKFAVRAEMREEMSLVFVMGGVSGTSSCVLPVCECIVCRALEVWAA